MSFYQSGMCYRGHENVLRAGARRCTACETFRSCLPHLKETFVPLRLDLEHRRRLGNEDRIDLDKIGKKKN